MKSFAKFIPLTKIEEQGDGTLHVFGLVTAEEPDLEREVCDYEGTKVLYQKRTQEHLQKTSLPGMTPSLMPFREMHDTKVQGAGRSLVCDDEKKTIKMGFHVVSSEAVKLWKAGCFVGFSQGGTYVKQWPDPTFDGCTRYIADPIEVSAVDTPCLPSALVETMKGRTVQFAKSTGVTEEVPLQIIPVSEVDHFSTLLKSENSVRALLGIADQPKAARAKIIAAAEKVGIVPSDDEKKLINKTCATLCLEKGLYEVGWMAQILEELHWLCIQTEFELEMEDDGSKVPSELRDSWLAMIETFKEMAEEEADELAAIGGKGAKGMKITDQAGLTKAAKTIHDHLAKALEMHKAHGEHMDKCMKAMSEKHEAMGDHIEKCMKAAKDAAEGDEPEKTAPAPELAKSVAEDPAFIALQKQLTDLTAKLAATPAPAQNLPASGVPGAITEKSLNIAEDFAKLLQ